MEATWRWFGPEDPISLEEIRQTGATGIVTALHEIPNGEVWPLDAIRERKALIEAAGLRWSVVESIPVHESIKQAAPGHERHIEHYQQSLRHLAQCGIETVCYNFMPVLDWTRTDLAWPLPEGGTALRFDQEAFAAFDLYLLERPNAEQDYSDEEQRAAQAHLEALDEAGRETLVRTIIAGLPGAEEGYSLAEFRTALAAYDGIDAARLRQHLAIFLKAIVPVAEEVGIRLAIHPDDPPRPMFGLPRVVSSMVDADWLLGVVPSPANGLTFCTGSYGANPDIDLCVMARRFAPYIHFAHLRATGRDSEDKRSFHEAEHLEGDLDMVGIISVLVAEERRRTSAGGALLPMRPDHGHHILDDAHRETRPGYPLYGRMKGLAELRGLEMAVRQLS